MGEILTQKVIDLRSDTVTKPTAAMRSAMARAEVGDDVYREDPTVIKLEKKVAELLGKEAALYVPTGTMGNLVSIMSHCWTRGLEILVGDQSHIYVYEQGGAAQLAGVHARAVCTKKNGTFDLDELESKIRKPTDIHQCITGLICLENTHNRCGGAVLPLDYIQKVCDLAKKYNIPVHMDGARICNAAVALEKPVALLVKDCASVSMCLSKGLGAPAGTVIAGSSEFISRALRCRKVVGGAMRQVGVLAATGLVALQNFEKQLKEDHLKAQKFGKEIASIIPRCPAVTVDMSQIQSNMVLLHFNTTSISAEQFVSRMKEVTVEEQAISGCNVIVKTALWSATTVRCVFHCDVSLDDIPIILKKMRSVIY